MNLARVQYHMIKRADESFNPTEYLKPKPGYEWVMDQTAQQKPQNQQKTKVPPMSAEDWKRTDAAFTADAMNREYADRAFRDQANVNTQGNIQVMDDRLRALSRINEASLQNPNAAALRSVPTEQPSQGPLQRVWGGLKGAWKAGERTGKEVADSITKGWNESQSYAPAVQGALNQIERDPKSMIPEVQQAEQSGFFSNGLNSLINWYQQQQATQAEAEKAARAARQARENTFMRNIGYMNGESNESALPKINEQSFQNPGAFNYSIPVDQLRGQQRQDPMGMDQQATNMEPAGYWR